MVHGKLICKLFPLVSIFVCLASSTVFSFQLPKELNKNDVLVNYINQPINSDTLFFSDTLKKALNTLSFYQQTVEACITTLKTEKGCSSGQHGIPVQTNFQDNIASTTIAVKDGVITLYPIFNRDLAPL